MSKIMLIVVRVVHSVSLPIAACINVHSGTVPKDVNL